LQDTGNQIQRKPRAGQKAAGHNSATRVALEPRAEFSKALLSKLTAHPGPCQDSAPEEAARPPQPHVAGKDAERARENRGRRANLAALDQQARRDTREIFRH